MPKRTDIISVLIIGAGPIIIGQACEFDYSGTQACKALREEGYRVVLINSNPATIMTDREFADRTYIEPITPECVEKIIVRELEEMKKMGVPVGVAASRQSAANLTDEQRRSTETPLRNKLVLLPTLGGQTALNTAMALHKSGVLEKYGVEMIGAKPDAIHKGEDRFAFKELMLQIGLAVSRSGGVEAGGSNIQFGARPENGRMVIIEMNPRASRSSALASKATGFPIAKIAAKLAVGYLLDELKTDITRETPASFEPSIDYVVTKIPRFAFEKFPQADPTLTTQMKSVGEAMAIWRTFKESLQKCLRSLEIGRSGLGADGKPWRIGTEVYGERDIC